MLVQVKEMTINRGKKKNVEGLGELRWILNAKLDTAEEDTQCSWNSVPPKQFPICTRPFILSAPFEKERC